MPLNEAEIKYRQSKKLTNDIMTVIGKNLNDGHLKKMTLFWLNNVLIENCLSLLVMAFVPSKSVVPN